MDVRNETRKSRTSTGQSPIAVLFLMRLDAPCGVLYTDQRPTRPAPWGRDMTATHSTWFMLLHRPLLVGLVVDPSCAACPGHPGALYLGYRWSPPPRNLPADSVTVSLGGGGSRQATVSRRRGRG